MNSPVASLAVGRAVASALASRTLLHILRIMLAAAKADGAVGQVRYRLVAHLL